MTQAILEAAVARRANGRWVPSHGEGPARPNPLSTPQAKLTAVLGAGQAVTRGVVRAQATPAPMLNRHIGSARTCLEPHLDLCGFERAKLRFRHENKARRGLPHRDASRFMYPCGSTFPEGLEESTPHTRLEVKDALGCDPQSESAVLASTTNQSPE